MSFCLHLFLKNSPFKLCLLLFFLLSIYIRKYSIIDFLQCECFGKIRQWGGDLQSLKL